MHLYDRHQLTHLRIR